VFVSRVRLIALCCLSSFVVLFVLFPTWLLTQHFNKQGFNNNYYIVFINDLCSVIKYSVYLRFAWIKIFYSTISSDDWPLMNLTYNVCKVVANFMKLNVRKCSLFHDVHGSVHHNTILIEMTNEMQLCRAIYYSIFP
jgi:hypothetical protein